MTEQPVKRITKWLTIDIAVIETELLRIVWVYPNETLRITETSQAHRR